MAFRVTRHVRVTDPLNRGVIFAGLHCEAIWVDFYCYAIVVFGSGSVGAGIGKQWRNFAIKYFGQKLVLTCSGFSADSDK